VAVLSRELQVFQMEKKLIRKSVIRTNNCFDSRQRRFLFFFPGKDFSKVVVFGLNKKFEEYTNVRPRKILFRYGHQQSFSPRMPFILRALAFLYS